MPTPLATGATDGTAVVYCEGAFGTPSGKTAHGLVRQTRRYDVAAVIDSRHAGRNAGDVLDGRPSTIPIVAALEDAVTAARAQGKTITHFVIGLAPDGGRLPPHARVAVAEAVGRGLHVDSGLHDYLTDDPELTALAARTGSRLRDVRKPKSTRDLHFFTGKIEEVDSVIVAVLGTDSAVGKRTTALVLEKALNAAGVKTLMIGTGQTAWMQGVRYGIILDSIVNDFVAGEIEHVIHTAWREERPQVLLLEGQGSLLNPAYPGGFELLAAGRPQAVILQHALARRDHDGFPGFPIGPVEKHSRLIEEISGRRVIAVTLNHEGMTRDEVERKVRELEQTIGRPVVDVLWQGAERLVEEMMRRFPKLGVGRGAEGSLPAGAPAAASTGESRVQA